MPATPCPPRQPRQKAFWLFLLLPPFNGVKMCQNLKMAQSYKITFLFCSTVKTLYINGFKWHIDL
jgi:hypothetical protein